MAQRLAYRQRFIQAENRLIDYLQLAKPWQKTLMIISVLLVTSGIVFMWQIRPSMHATRHAMHLRSSLKQQITTRGRWSMQTRQWRKEMIGWPQQHRKRLDHFLQQPDLTRLMAKLNTMLQHNQVSLHSMKPEIVRADSNKVIQTLNLQASANYKGFVQLMTQLMQSPWSLHVRELSLKRAAGDKDVRIHLQLEVYHQK